MCDSEHMFDCGGSTAGGTKHNVDVDELVRKFQVMQVISKLKCCAWQEKPNYAINY